MKKIVVLDTWVNDVNLGNKIIMEAVLQELREIFPGDFFYHVPAMEYVRSGRKLVMQADYTFLAGANLLSSDMNTNTSGWCVRLRDTLWMGGVVLLGLGWWQYQAYPPNLYTRTLLRQVLKRDCYHAARDSYTANRIEALGFSVLNVGCPTMWRLSKEHCAKISQTKAEKALLTFTVYKKSPAHDRLLFDIVKRNYSAVYFWPQMYGDYHYAKEICGNGLVFIDPSIEALDDLLGSEDLDHVGTRLHGGIRALQNKCRTIIIAVDNRATEMGRDFNLPVVQREKIAQQLEDTINGSWITRVNLNEQAISTWKNQFVQRGQFAEVHVSEAMKLRAIAHRILPPSLRTLIWRKL